MTRLFYALPLAWLIETVRAVAWLALFPLALVVVWAVECGVMAVRGRR